MRKAVRAIIVHNNNLLVMARNKFGQKYVTLPGGGVEPAESLDQAIVREVLEETSITADEPVLRYLEHAGDPYGNQYIFSLTYRSGEPKLAATSPEEQINKLGKNLYEPYWLPIEKLQQTPMVSGELKEILLKDFIQGLPSEVVEFTWN
mgnify:CR=1 FL=1